MKRFGLLLVIGVLTVLCTQLPSQEKKAGTPGVAVDKEAKTITIDCKMAPRKLPHLKEIYPLEVIACWPHPKGKKAHETIVSIDDAVKPSDVHKAIESLGLKAGKPVQGEGDPKGPAVLVYLLINDSTGLPRKITMDKAMIDSRNGKPFPKNIEWRFTGSAITQPDPAKDKIYGADFSGTFLVIFPVTAETVLQTELTIKYEGIMKLELNDKVLPKEGTPVKLVIEVPKK
jgi:hypothetical protein